MIFKENAYNVPKLNQDIVLTKTASCEFCFYYTLYIRWELSHTTKLQYGSCVTCVSCFERNPVKYQDICKIQ